MKRTTFEATFEVSGSPASHWEALRALQDGQPDGTWYLPGFESTGSEIDVEPGRSLRLRKDSMPCEGTTIAVTFTDSATGTRITVVQSGFDAAFLDQAGDAFWMVAEHIAADFELFFRFGVQGGRHARPWAWAGWQTETSGVGLEITEVHDGTYASRAGIEPGDVVLTLAGAPLLTERDLATVLRVVSPGSEIDVTWARGDQHHAARAVF
ncbi:MAG: PDZ domain-containing protein [Acidimicrobiales bacterium]